jgi:hypothetical protein
MVTTVTCFSGEHHERLLHLPQLHLQPEGDLGCFRSGRARNVGIHLTTTIRVFGFIREGKGGLGRERETSADERKEGAETRGEVLAE